MDSLIDGVFYIYGTSAQRTALNDSDFPRPIQRVVFKESGGSDYEWDFAASAWVETRVNGAALVNITNTLISYHWAGADDTNAPDATDLPDYIVGVSASGASTGVVYHVIDGAWVSTGATVANLYGG